MEADTKKKLRAIGGFLAILTLLGLLVADFLYPELQLKSSTINVLLVMIAGLLGVDILAEELPLRISVEKGDDDEVKNRSDNDDTN